MFSKILSFLLVWSSLYSVAFSNSFKKNISQNEVVINNDTSKIVVNKIILSGNKITKQQIIFREILFRENDTIEKSKLKDILEQSRKNLLNTSLFNFVTIDTTHVSNENINIKIDVIERWYIWPMPYLKLNDRNFNVWWQTKDIDKIDYGIDFTWENFRGRKEILVLLVRMGYDETFGLLYKIPYINKSKTLGIGVSGGFSGNHEIPYKDSINKQVFIKDKGCFIQQNIFGTFNMTYRKNIFNTHTFQINFNDFTFADTLLKLNSSYASQNRVQFFTFYYLFKSDHRDIAAYPLKGYYTEFQIEKYGFDLLNKENVNMDFAYTSIRKYWNIYNRWYFAGCINAKVSTNSNQPYFLERGLGFGNDFVRSYEYYVVDGQDYALLKSNLKFQLVQTKVKDLNFIPSKKFSKLYYSIYLNLIADAGYTVDRNPPIGNKLSNTFLFGTGIGLDFVTYYDKVYRFEYTINKMGESGFFIHFVAPI